MPIVITPTKAGMQDIDRSTFKQSGYDVDKKLNKKTKEGSMDSMREYMDTLHDIDEVEVDEGKGSYKNMMVDIEDGMDKEEFEREYPGSGDMYDEIKQEIIDRANEDVQEPIADVQQQDIEMEDDSGCDDEAIDAMVSVPVQELQDILQLAGYQNYSEKIAEYANEPEEEYSSVEDQLIGLSGGLNGPKKMYPASADGDNPMNQEPREVEETMEAVEEKLYKSYKDFLEEAEIKVDEDSEFDNVVKSRNEIKINKYLAKQDPKTADRLGKKHYGKDYKTSSNPMRQK